MGLILNQENIKSRASDTPKEHSLVHPNDAVARGAEAKRIMRATEVHNANPFYEFREGVGQKAKSLTQLERFAPSISVMQVAKENEQIQRGLCQSVGPLLDWNNSVWNTRRYATDLR